jgi:hypothetical protein
MDYIFIDIDLPWTIGEGILLYWYWFTLKNRRRSTSLLILIYPEELEKDYSFFSWTLPFILFPIHLFFFILTLHKFNFTSVYLNSYAIWYTINVWVMWGILWVTMSLHWVWGRGRRRQRTKWEQQRMLSSFL